MTAFVLDAEKVQASEDGMTIPPLPGLWTNETPILPAALGLTLSDFQEMIDELGLPLVAVSVPASKALEAFPKPDYLLESETSANAIARLHGLEAPVDEAPVDEIEPENVDLSQAEQAASDAAGTPQEESA